MRFPCIFRQEKLFVNIYGRFYKFSQKLSLISLFSDKIQPNA